MEDISITVRVPAVNGTFDFLVPKSMNVLDVQKLMIRILSSEYGVQDNPRQVLLIDTKDGNALRSECSLLELNILDGAELLMV